MKTAFRLDAAGRRCCNTPGCWQPFPCAAHAGVMLGSRDLRTTWIAPLDEACEECGYLVCASMCPTQCAPAALEAHERPPQVSVQYVTQSGQPVRYDPPQLSAAELWDQYCAQIGGA